MLVFRSEIVRKTCITWSQCCTFLWCILNKMPFNHIIQLRWWIRFAGIWFGHINDLWFHSISVVPKFEYQSDARHPNSHEYNYKHSADILNWNSVRLIFGLLAFTFVWVAIPPILFEPFQMSFVQQLQNSENGIRLDYVLCCRYYYYSDIATYALLNWSFSGDPCCTAIA